MVKRRRHHRNSSSKGKMPPSNFSGNLRVLCSYAPSISKICRDLRINRQQFHRYLNGDSEPSLRKIRSICDYFGLEESEILLDPTEFKKIILIRKIKPSLPDPFGNFIVKLHDINPDAAKDIREYVGFYHTYIRTAEIGGRILKSITKIYMDNDYAYCKTIENYANIAYRSRKSLKYTGVVFHTGGEIYVHERERIAGRMIWTTILNPVDRDQFSVMTGLTLGVNSASRRGIIAYRVAWERIDSKMGLRRMLAVCGVHEDDSEEVSPAIKAAIKNDVAPDEMAFAARPWHVDQK